VQTVGDILGGDTTEQPVVLVPPPSREGAVQWPGPGIHFGLDEDTYHAIHACSASGLKDLSMSSMDYWAKSVLNPDREDEDTVFKTLGRAYHVRILEGRARFQSGFGRSLEKGDYEGLIVTIDDANQAIEKAGYTPPKKGTPKPAVLRALAEAVPDALVWDALVETHAKANEGKTLIPSKSYNRIEVAAAMIEGDPYLKQAFTGGYPEVTLFWWCPRTGAPMKARIDYLKMRTFNDLKSFSNPVGRPIERAIDFTIASRKYYLPTVVYSEGIAAVKQQIKELGGLDCIHGPDDQLKELRHWVWEWAHQPEPECLMVFQQTGNAPVTRGRRMTRGTTYEVTSFAVQMLKRRWVECAKEFGSDPWIDVAPIRDVVDDEMPMSATDYGTID
jgi:hypothetical protein